MNKCLESLSALQNFISDFNYDSVFFVGEFSDDRLSDRACGSSKNFWRETHKCVVMLILWNRTVAFTGYGNSASIWLDHLVGNFIIILNMLNHVGDSDYAPLAAVLQFTQAILSQETRLNICHNDENKGSFVNWKNLKVGDLDNMNVSVDNLIKKKLTYSPAENCHRTGCHNPAHLECLNNMYNMTVSSILVGSND